MPDDLRTRILHTLINNTPPKYLAMPGDLSDLVTALIRDIPELQARCCCQRKNWATDE